MHLITTITIIRDSTQVTMEDIMEEVITEVTITDYLQLY
jgi:hypothetical protein